MNLIQILKKNYLKSDKGLKGIRLLFESGFLICFGLYLAYLTLNTTMFYFVFPENFSIKLLHFFALIIIGKIISSEKFDRRMALAAAFGIVSMLVFYQDGSTYDFLIFMALAVIGSIGTSYKKILKMFIIVAGIITLSAVIAALSGSIPNLVYMKRNYLRSAWGNSYVTDFASIILFLLLIIWTQWEKLPEFAGVFFALISLCTAWYVAKSTTSTISSILFLVVVMYMITEKKWLKNSKSGKNVIKVVDFISAAAFPICMIIFFLIVFLYKKGTAIGIKLNEFMSDRPACTLEAFKTYGVKLFGVKFDQSGAGGSVFSPLKYNFVDDSYALILIKYGCIMFVMIMLAWIYITVKARKSGNRRLMLMLLLVAVHSISEHHFIEMNYNICIMLMFADFPLRSECGGTEQSADSKMCFRKCIAAGITAIITVISIFAGGPFAVSMLRTFVGARKWDASVSNNEFFTFTGITIFIIFSIYSLNIALKWILCRKIKISGGIENDMGSITERDAEDDIESGTKNVTESIAEGDIENAAKNNENQGKRFSGVFHILPVSVAILIIVFVFIKGNEFCHGLTKMPEYSEEIVAESKAMQVIENAASGKIYAANMPELYLRCFGNITRSVLSGDDLARKRNITEIVSLDDNSQIFLNSGFLYCPISEKTAIYTDDKKVIYALKKAGYHLTAYCTAVYPVDLANLAALNSISLDNGNLVLANGNKIGCGPYVNLYAGRYTIRFWLTVSPDVLKRDENATICNIGVYAYVGQKTIVTLEVKANQFDEKGGCVVELPFISGNYQNVEFKCLPEINDSIVVGRIEYQVTPDYDVHTTYDKKHRRIRDEYYDLTGKPVIVKEGYSAIEYEYDKAGNVKTNRYFGEDNKPIIIAGGFAETHFSYNLRKQIISQTYFGIDGKPIAVQDGSYGYEYKYDKSGNRIFQRSIDAKGNPIISTAGYAEIHRTFNGNNNIISESYYGKKSEPIALPSGEYAREYGYDENRNINDTKFLGKDGELMNINGGYAEEKKVFNGQGLVVRDEYYGTAGQPVICSNGYFAIDMTYDMNGRVIKEMYYSTDGKSISLSSGECGHIYEYDDAGNKSDITYIDGNSQPVAIGEGYARIHNKYDDKGHIIRQEYFKNTGEAFTFSTGYSIKEDDYSADGDVTEERYYDADSKPVLINGHYAALKWTYNDKHQQISEERYGKNKEKILGRDGVFLIKKKNDENNNSIVIKYYDTNGKPALLWNQYAEIHRTFNKENQLVEESYYGQDGKALTLSSNVAATKFKYDKNGNVVDVLHYDKNGDKVVTTYGYAEIKRTYNEKGQMISESYYDLDGILVNVDAGYAMMKKQYDKYGNVKKIDYYDNKEKEAMNWGQYSEVVYKYDSHNRSSSEAYYDQEGHNKPATSGQYGCSFGYNEIGECVIYRYLGRDMKICITSDGYAEMKRKYDAQGNPIEDTYYDVNENPVENKEGIAKIVRKYDENGNVIEEKHFNLSGKEI